MSFKKDVIETFLTQIILFIIELFSTILLARFLGPEGKGIYSLALLLPTMLLTFSSLGLSKSLIYHFGEKVYPNNQLINSSINLFVIINIITILIGIIIIHYFNVIFFKGVKSVYLFFSLFLLPFNFFNSQILDSILLGFNKFKIFNLSRFLYFVIKLILIVLFVVILNYYIIGSLFSYLLAFIFTIIITILIIFKYIIEIKYYWIFNKKIIRSLLNFGFKIQLGSICGFLHLKIDNFILNFFLNPIAVGFYTIAVSVAEKI